jgi:hypothetical protein
LLVWSLYAVGINISFFAYKTRKENSEHVFVYRAKLEMCLRRLLLSTADFCLQTFFKKKI